MIREFQGPPRLASRKIVHNMPLCDGTPRKERGFRAFVEYRGVRGHGRFCRSPLFSERAQAVAWAGDASPVSAKR